MKRKKTIIFIMIMIAVLIAPSLVFSGQDEGDTDITLTVEGACGNGMVDSGEGCDGSAGVSSGYTCNSSCQLEQIVQGGGSSAVPGSTSDISIYNIFSDLSTDEAEINWDTNKDAICRLGWGDTDELKNGLLEEVNEKRSHKTLLSNLLPGTDYWFQIYCFDEYGHKAETEIKKITTKKPLDLTAPANVSEFTAIAQEEVINLNWINPEDNDFRAVKIMRSEVFYPTHIFDGVETYNDSGENYIDYDVKAGIRYYYTVFSYDNNGNYSSGSIATAIILEDGVVEEEKLPLEDIPLAKPEDRIEIDLRDFSFYIANETIEIKNEDNNFELLPGTILDIKTLKSIYPEKLKSIIITHAPREGNKTKEAKSYLLRADDKDNNFSTRFTSPLKINDYNLFLYFLNYDNALIARTEGLFKIEGYGKITNINFIGSFIKPANAAEIGVNTGEGVYGADISLYSLDENGIKRWQGERFSQFNPLFSNKNGQYGFLVPDGRYLVEVNKKGFYSYTSLPFQVENNLVKENISLIHYPMLDWKKFLINLFIALTIFYIVKKYKDSKSEKKKSGPTALRAVGPLIE